VKAKTERWKLHINKHAKTVTNGDSVVDELKKDMVATIEFWEGNRNP